MIKYGSDKFWELNKYCLSQINIPIQNKFQRQTFMSKQSELIGEHPKLGLFADWCKCEDITSIPTKKYRKLSDKGINRDSLIEQLADYIIIHHISPNKIEQFEKKKSILKKHEFEQYVIERMPFPIKNDKTIKGNFGEIILAEYLKASSSLELLIYKLRFNPNIEQSMKGDDILLFNKLDINTKIIMGEAKFRATKSKQALDDIINSLSKNNLPISLTFVSNRLSELGEHDLSNDVDDLISKVHSKKLPVIYVGFYHSELEVSTTIETHLNTDNENLVLISYGEQNPEKLIKESFDKAIEKIMS